MCRFVLACVVALHVVASPLAAIAASGWREDSVCCCPDQRTCQCPHDDHGNGADMLRRCGDAGEAIVPVLDKIVVPVIPLAPVVTDAPSIAVAEAADEDPDERWVEPETPPF